LSPTLFREFENQVFRRVGLPEVRERSVVEVFFVHL
jgi:hypothetical protein